MKTKLVIVGSAGRMGKRLVALAAESGKFEIIAAVEKKGHPDFGKDAGLVTSAGRLNIEVGCTWPEKTDVVIDFSQPEAADKTVNYCVDNKTALVLGTTGLSSEQHERTKKASEKIPIIYGANMSIGMNVLFSLVESAAGMLGEDYDIEIIEQHHRFKKDAPSGSALTLAEKICKATDRDIQASVIYGREGKNALRKKGQIGIHAVRAGDITGIHSIIFSTLGETVTLNHTAHSRDTFARGALRAAQWLLGKKPALYSIADVLGLK
ncbi:4-hydroxy-tetrahydrodipicolinate reductase [subsurface metagenome]